MMNITKTCNEIQKRLLKLKPLSENLVLPVATDPTEVSPKISKSMSCKRSKFSHGMFIKQSQNDEADEVTWKISPVNERLQAISKHMPKMI